MERPPARSIRCFHRLCQRCSVQRPALPSSACSWCCANCPQSSRLQSTSFALPRLSDGNCQPGRPRWAGGQPAMPFLHTSAGRVAIGNTVAALQEFDPGQHLINHASPSGTNFPYIRVQRNCGADPTLRIGPYPQSQPHFAPLVCWLIGGPPCVLVDGPLVINDFCCTGTREAMRHSVLLKSSPRRALGAT